MAGFTVSANGRVDSNPDVNELHARMTTKQAAPETPLPWQLDENRFIVRQHFTVADCGPEERHHINAAYIVHACNAYPRLEAERAELVAETHRLRRLLADIYDHARQIPMGGEGTEQESRLDAIISASSLAQRSYK